MKRTRRGLMLLLLAALTTVGCTVGNQAVSASSAKPSGASNTSLGAQARCPVTRPVPHASPPGQLAAGPGAPLPVPYIHGWYGNAELWIGVPTHGMLPASPDPQTPGQWGTKFPWWRVIPGTLTITARRLDGPSAGFHGQVPAGYGDVGFTPSGLIWPAPGCWQVTGTIAGHTLAFVTLVKFVKS